MSVCSLGNYLIFLLLFNTKWDRLKVNSYTVWTVEISSFEQSVKMAKWNYIEEAVKIVCADKSGNELIPVTVKVR